MQRLMADFYQPKTRLMVALRIMLVALIILMALARLRLILIVLASPTSYQERDVLQEYLMAKALVTGINPYLPLDSLAERFIGQFSFLPHPAPYPPFVAILSTPLLVFSLNQVIIVWFLVELVCLMAISAMITVLWKGKLVWLPTLFIFFLLLCWYPVMVDLLYGQLTILLTTLVLAALLALRKDKQVLSGILVGLSVAIKMFTWPLMIYFLVKKDWRAFISSGITLLGLNLVALAVLGIGPVSDYYLRVTSQVSAIYHAFVKNYSLWSLGYRFFAGTQPVGGEYISAPPLVNLPNLAPIVSAGLAAVFLAAGLIWAIRLKNVESAYAIMVCVLVGISPISWDHYYVMLTIALAVLLINLSRRSFPNGPTTVFIVIALMLFLFNDHIADLMFLLNGGINVVKSQDNRISFASSLLEILPMLELVILSVLLWRVGRAGELAENIN